MKKLVMFKKFRWLAIALMVALTATTVYAAASPYILDSFSMTDPLDTSVTWWRDTTNQNALAQYSQDQFPDQIVPLYLTDGFKVYEYVSARGPNITVLTTARNYFIIGCGGSTDEATYAKSKLGGTTSGKILRGIVMTSASPEDIWGCKVWTKGQLNIIVYAANSFDDAMQNNFFVEEGLIDRRQMLLGTNLPWGSDSFLGAGTMKEYRAVPPQYWQYPNIHLTQPIEISLDGNIITLMPTLKEDAGMMVKLNTPNILILGEFFGPYLPDVGYLQNHGLAPTEVITFLDSVRALSPSTLVYKSGLPVVGSAEVQTAVTAQRDAMQYLRDQTVGKINQLYALDDIVAAVHLPDSLASSPYNQEFASDVPSIIRWVYTYYMGWFNGEPVELADTLTETTQAQILADAYGGLDDLISAARQAELDASDQAGAEKALYLAYSAYKLAPDDFTVKQIYAQALRKNAFMQRSAYKRNYYLTAAQNQGTEQMVSDISKTGQEDTALTFTATEFSQHFNGIGGALLTTVKIVSLPLGETGVLTLDGVDVTAGQEIALADLNGLVFTPLANWNGSASFLWNGRDGSGYAANDASVRITLDPVNDPPVVSSAPLADVTVDEDAPSSTIDLSTGFNDVDGETLTYTAASDAAGVSATVNGSTLTLAYQANWNGSAAVTVTATDTANASVTASFKVAVNPVNDPPTANDASITVVAGKSQAITLDYGDVETTQANLQVTFGSLHGTLDTSALPNLTYTAPSTAGDDSFIYTVTDRGDPDGCVAAPCVAPLFATATVHVTVLPAPSGSISGVVFNDTNANGTLDAGETGLAGVVVQLQDAGGSQLETFTSGVDGTYTFSGLDAGSYLVYAPKDADRVQTTQNPITVSLAEAQVATGVNIGSVVSADLRVSMTYSVNNKQIIYTITVTNDGPANALNATLADVLPEGVGYVTVLSSMGNCNGGKTVTCDFGTLAYGSSVTVTLKVNRTNNKIAIENTVTVSSSVFDIDLAHNSATVTTP